MTLTSSPTEDRRLMIRASAGSGKTFQLALRFIGLLAEDRQCDEILATTFTRKAAGEILGRVVMMLAQGARQTGSSAQRKALREQVGLSPQNCRDILTLVARNLHRMRICTLDSFFAQIARSYSLELGLPPSWRIVDELQDERLRRAAVGRILREQDYGVLLRLVHLMTKGEAERGVARLMLDTVNNLYQLYLESEPDAWTVNDLPRPLTADQLQAAGERLLQAAEQQSKSIASALRNAWQSVLAEDWESVLEKGLGVKIIKGETTYSRQEITPELKALLQPLTDHAAGVLFAQLEQQTGATLRLLQLFDEAYGDLKLQQRAYRFEDVTRRLSQAGLANAVDDLAVRLDSRIEQLLIDEFQDTSPSQWRAVEPFALRTAASPHRSFFCVGDVKQAIYGWRGGDARLFDVVQSVTPGIQSKSLSESFRSCQVVIDTVNRIFTRAAAQASPGRSQDAVAAWCEQFEAHVTHIGSPGFAALLPIADDATGDEGQDKEAAFEQAAELAAGLAAARPDLSVGVLVRTNHAVGRLVALLRQRGAHASEEGGNPLTDSAAVLAVLAVMQLADHPGDRVARFHVAHTPLLEALEVSGPPLHRPSADEQARAASRKIRSRLLHDGYGPTVRWLAEKLLPHCSPREANRLNQLVELAYGYQAQATLRPARFVRYVEREKRQDPSSAKIRVMTVHQSKGLQFDSVILPELGVNLTGQTPTCIASRTRPDHPVDLVFRYVKSCLVPLAPPRLRQAIEETLHRDVNGLMCLLYVAVTRAKNGLYMLVPKQKESGQSLAGLLCATLADAGHPQPAVPRPDPDEPAPIGWSPDALYSAGDPLWYRRQAPKPAAQPSRERTATAPAPLAIAPPRSDRRRALEQVAPSRHRNAARPMADWMRELGDATGRRRGELMHLWFEQISWLEDGEPSDSELRRLAAAMPDLASHLPHWIADFRRALRQPAFQELLSRERYRRSAASRFTAQAADKLARVVQWEVHREAPYALVRDGALIQGVIDRLVLGRDDRQVLLAEILDYKTDTQLEGAAERHRRQMDEYRWAVRRIHRLDEEQTAVRLLLVRHAAVIDMA